MTYRFWRTCVNIPREDVPELSRMIEHGKEITRRTFMRHCHGARDVFLQLGYAPHPTQGLTAAADYHIGYFRSTWLGQTCYFFTWSLIEHIFREEARLA